MRANAHPMQVHACISNYAQLLTAALICCSLPKAHIPQLVCTPHDVCMQELPWRRVDVSFKGTGSWASTHNLIQVTSKTSHYVGVGVPRHLAQQFAAMEELEARRGSARRFQDGHWI